MINLGLNLFKHPRCIILSSRYINIMDFDSGTENLEIETVEHDSIIYFLWEKGGHHK